MVRHQIVEVFLAKLSTNSSKRRILDHATSYFGRCGHSSSLVLLWLASQSHHHVTHHHYHNASAPIAEGSAPADTLSAHDAHMKNLHRPWDTTSSRRSRCLRQRHEANLIPTRALTRKPGSQYPGFFIHAPELGRNGRGVIRMKRKRRDVQARLRSEEQNVDLEAARWISK